MKTVVIYSSISGFTKKYAQWIAQTLNTDLFESRNISPAKMSAYDTIIYGGSLHAVGISGLRLIKNNIEKLKQKNIIVFAVGASPLKGSLLTEILQNNFDQESHTKIKLFYLRGGFDFNKLNTINKIIMMLFKFLLVHKKARTPDEQGMLDAYAKPVDYTNKENIDDLLHYVNSLK